MEKMVASLDLTQHQVTFLIHSNYSGPYADVNLDRVNYLFYQPPEGLPTMCTFSSVQTFMDTPVKEVVSTFYTSSLAYCRAILGDKALMESLKRMNFDLAVYDVVDPCSRILADYMDVPFITFHSHGVDTLMPRNPAYLPSMMTTFSDHMNFYQRMLNTVGYLILKVVKYSVMKMIDDVKAEFRLNATTSVADAYDRASVNLVLGDFALDYVRPIQPNTILIGGFVQPPQRALPEDLRDILDASIKQGVIVFSFGTFVQDFEPHWQEFFAEVFASLPYTVIWRYRGVPPRNLGNNTHIFSWLPQFHMLRHPSICAFITHSGFNSVYEAAYQGVPVVAIPLFGEQPYQATKITEHVKMGLKLNIHSLTKEKFKNAIMEVAASREFKQNAMQVSHIMRNKPLSQKELLRYWFNHVIMTGGMPHLRSKELNMSWYQLWLLDVAAAYAVAFATLYIVFKWFIKYLAKFMHVHPIANRFKGVSSVVTNENCVYKTVNDIIHMSFAQLKSKVKCAWLYSFFNCILMTLLCC